MDKKMAGGLIAGAGIIAAVVLIARRVSAGELPPIQPGEKLGNVYGVVSENGIPLSGVRVAVPEAGKQLTTVANGLFAFQLESERSWVFEFSKEGYYPLTMSVDVETGENSFNAELNPLPSEEEPPEEEPPVEEPPTLLRFTYNFSCIKGTCPSATAYGIAQMSAVIRNNNSVPVTRNVKVMWSRWSKTYSKWVSCAGQFVSAREDCICSLSPCALNPFPVSLSPGAQQNFSYAGWCTMPDDWRPCIPALMTNYNYYFWLEDDAGGKSNEVVLST